MEPFPGIFRGQFFHEGLFPAALPFRAEYKNFSMALYHRSAHDEYGLSDYEAQSHSGLNDTLLRGGKVIMPPSALETLTRLNIQYPMLFCLENPKTGRKSHCGVQEFTAQEGYIYLPYWMQQNLELSEGDNVKVDNVSLPIATYAKFQPLHEEFLDINNPKAVLENTLRNFGCLTKGDNLIIYYNDHEYQLTVLELKPANAVCVIECDVNVEFAEALIKSSHGPEPMDTSGSPTVPAAHAVAAAVQPVVPSDPFSSCGVGRRLDGKVIRNENGKTTSTASASTAPVSQGRESSTVPKSASAWSSRPSSAVNGQLPERGIPNYNHTPGRVTFNRIAVDANAPSSTEATQQQKSEKESERGPVPFAGAGHQLRPTRKH